VIELGVALAVTAAIGWVRPRWSSLAVAAIPTGLAFAWLFLHEDIPGYRITPSDVAWYLGMSFVVGAAFALACSLGILAGKATGRGDTAGNQHGV
jgi:hypothetical protein